MAAQFRHGIKGQRSTPDCIRTVAAPIVTPIGSGNFG